MSNFDPMKEISSVRDQVNRVFQDAFSGTGRNLAVDIYENRDELVIVAGPVYGLDVQSIDIEVHQGQVTLRGITSDPLTIAEDQYLRRERRFGEFSRTVALPRRVDTNAAKARYKDGILTVSFPKLAGEQPRVVRVTVEEEGE